MAEIDLSLYEEIPEDEDVSGIDFVDKSEDYKEVDVSSVDLSQYEEVKEPTYIDPETKEETTYEYLSDVAETVSDVTVDTVGQAVKDTSSAIKAQASQIGATINASLAQLNELVGLDSSLFRDNEKFYQSTTKEAKDELSTTYGEGDGILKDALVSTANPINYVGGAKPIAVGIQAGIDTIFNKAGQEGESNVDLDNTGDVAVSASAGIVAGKVFDWIFSDGTKAVKTSFGKEIDKLPEADRIKLLNTIDTLKENGIDDLGEKGRRELVDTIDFSKSTEEVSSQIKYELTKLRGKSEQNVKNTYESANKIANTTEAVETKGVKALASLDKNGDIKIPSKKGDKKAYRAYNDVMEILGGKTKLTAKGIEDKLKLLKEGQRSVKPNAKTYYGKAIDELQKIQDKLLKDKKIPDTYNNARDVWTSHQKDFTGRIKGKGSGAKINKTLLDDNEFDVATKVLTKGLDANTAKNLSDIGLSKQARSDAVKDIMLDGIDIDDVGTSENISKIVNKWNSFDANGKKAMMGKDYLPFKKKIEALEVINNRVKTLTKNGDESIARDMENLATYTALSGASPFFAMKGMISSGKNIITKKVANKSKSNLMRRFEKIEDKQVRSKLLGALSSVMSSQEYKKD